MQSDGASCRVVPVGGVYAFDNFQTTAEDLSATSYTYDAANQLTAMNVDGTTTNFTYDDWGRMAGKTQGAYAAAYTYRFGDKLKAVTSNFPGETASVGYNYDGLGRRRLEQLDNTTATWFRWSGSEECGEYAGTVGSWTIGALQTGYVPGLGTFAGSNPATAEWRYHLTDHLGSVRQLSGQTKAALAHYDYAPYGELMRSAGLPLTVGYTGHLWDSAIGQYYAPFRYYNPQTARWNMRDPLGFVDGPNVYAYVSGNPVNFMDPLGLDGLTPCAQAVLKEFFPEVDLSKININTRIPIYVKVPPGKVFGYKTPFKLNKINIRKPSYSQETISGLALIAHELQHVVQATQEGLGKWTINYILDNILHGYKNSKYEKDANNKQTVVAKMLTSLYKDSNPCP